MEGIQTPDLFPVAPQWKQDFLRLRCWNKYLKQFTINSLYEQIDLSDRKNYGGMIGA